MGGRDRERAGGNEASERVREGAELTTCTQSGHGLLHAFWTVWRGCVRRADGARGDSGRLPAAAGAHRTQYGAIVMPRAVAVAREPGLLARHMPADSEGWSLYAPDAK